MIRVHHVHGRGIGDNIDAGLADLQEKACQFVGFRRAAFAGQLKLDLTAARPHAGGASPCLGIGTRRAQIAIIATFCFIKSL